MARIYTDDAELYDIAFDWDISDEVDWLLERLGPDCRRVLEPGCGSGRMLEALAQRSLAVTGIDLSVPMLELARRRLGDRGTVIRADMTDFDLGETFDGAVCPINTLTLLTRGISRQRSRIEVLPGARAGDVLEEIHETTAWTPETWREAIAASPFSEAATYDGGRKGSWPSVPPTATGGLLWHELSSRARLDPSSRPGRTPS